MISTPQLGAYWHDDSSLLSFNRVRCISTGGHMTPQTYSTLEKTRSNSAPVNSYSSDVLLTKRMELNDNGYINSLISQPERDDKHETLEENINLSRSNSRSHSRTGSVKGMGPASTLDPATKPLLCMACSQRFEPSDLVVLFEENAYHNGCFACGVCGTAMDPTCQFLVQDDGSPICCKCSPVCHVCNATIIRDHVWVLNKDFHEDCLKCSRCKKVLGKVYAAGGEPCCAECITPVFDATWSPRASSNFADKTPDDRKLSSSGPHTLPPRLESLSQAVNDLPSVRFHTLLRPSFSFPAALSHSTSCSGKLSLSSLRAILYDELGVTLLMNFCIDDSSIEYMVFWLDVEHFKYFDGASDDINLFAHHIMLKYIGYYAEIPLGLPRSVEDRIVTKMQQNTVSQDIFSEAQEYVFQKMEKEIHARFLCSNEGQTYLKALVSRDIRLREKQKQEATQTVSPIEATVKSFDKRHLGTKFYVYEMEVKSSNSVFMIYRRYSDFHSLHQELRSTYPTTKLPALPKKIYFGRSQTKAVAQQRMKDLQIYLQGVLSMPPDVSCCSILRQFLTQTAQDKEDEAFNKRINGYEAAEQPWLHGQ